MSIFSSSITARTCSSVNAKAYVLDELNRHHMDEEEQTHFPTLADMASKEKMDQLFQQYQEAEEKAKPS